MKRIIHFFTIALLVCFMSSCNDYIRPETSWSEDTTDITDSPSGTPGSLDAPCSEQMADSEQEEHNTELEQEPEHEYVFELISEPYREVKYSGCHIYCQVNTNIGLIADIPEDCDWITQFDGYYSEDPLTIKLSVASILPTLEERETFKITNACLGTDRQCTITLWDSSKTHNVTVTVKQLCYGCSYEVVPGDEIQGDDIIVNF